MYAHTASDGGGDYSSTYEGDMVRLDVVKQPRGIGKVGQEPPLAIWSVKRARFTNYSDDTSGVKPPNSFEADKDFIEVARAAVPAGCERVALALQGLLVHVGGPVTLLLRRENRGRKCLPDKF